MSNVLLKRLFVLAMIGMSALGNSQTFAFSASYDGVSDIVEVIDPGPPVVRFATAATGSGSFDLNSYASSDIVNMATGVGSGSSTFTAGNGDRLFGNFNVQLVPGGNPGQVTLSGLLVFAGGTGLFAGATGQANLTGSGQFTSPTSANAHFDYGGQLTLAPEPATLSLLIPVMAVVLKRRKRSA